MNPNGQLVSHNRANCPSACRYNHITLSSELETHLKFLPPIRDNNSCKPCNKADGFLPIHTIIHIKIMCKNDSEKCSTRCQYCPLHTCCIGKSIIKEKIL